MKVRSRRAKGGAPFPTESYTSYVEAKRFYKGVDSIVITYPPIFSYIFGLSLSFQGSHPVHSCVH